MSTKRVDSSIYLGAPNYFFNIKKIAVENVVENDM
jgi:hypothetical protein